MHSNYSNYRRVKENHQQQHKSRRQPRVPYLEAPLLPRRAELLRGLHQEVGLREIGRVAAPVACVCRLFLEEVGDLLVLGETTCTLQFLLLLPFQVPVPIHRPKECSLHTHDKHKAGGKRSPPSDAPATPRDGFDRELHTASNAAASPHISSTSGTSTAAEAVTAHCPLRTGYTHSSHPTPSTHLHTTSHPSHSLARTLVQERIQMSAMMRLSW